MHELDIRADNKNKAAAMIQKNLRRKPLRWTKQFENNKAKQKRDCVARKQRATCADVGAGSRSIAGNLGYATFTGTIDRWMID